MKRIVPLIMLAAVICAGCEDSPVIPEETQLVLQAYLYAGQPVTDVTVMMSLPFSGADSTNVPVADATVTLIRGGNRYLLAASIAEPGRYTYAGTDLEVRAGDRFRIEVNHGNTVVDAETVVPDSPTNLRVSLDTVRFERDTITTPMGGIRVMITTADSLRLSWENPSRLAHYLVVASVDEQRTPLQSDSVRVPMRLRFVNEPTTFDFTPVMPFSFNYTGRHALLLYRVNQEYVDLYASRQQDSRTLNEPRTNVRNGLGIFTAFNCDSVFVVVAMK